MSLMTFLLAVLSRRLSYPVYKGYINGLVSPQQILLAVYTYYIVIPYGVSVSASEGGPK